MKIAALTLALLVGASAGALAQDHSSHGAAAMSGASQEYMEAMKRMDQSMQGMTMTGKPGLDFAEMMIPHHQAAIDMAKSYLATGDNNAELVALSNEIIAAQEREIAQLQKWIAANK